MITAKESIDIARIMVPTVDEIRSEFIEIINRRIWWITGKTVDETIFERLLMSYDEKTSAIGKRHYHTFDHVRDCLGWLKWSRDYCYAVNGKIYEQTFIALCYHDVVYYENPLERIGVNNEVGSANRAMNDLYNAGAPISFATDVAALILATDYGRWEDNGELIADIDLVSLAYDWPIIQKNGDDIRAEYANVSDKDFFRARHAFFEKILTKPRLYRWGIFQQLFTERAKENIRKIMVDAAARF